MSLLSNSRTQPDFGVLFDRRTLRDEVRVGNQRGRRILLLQTLTLLLATLSLAVAVSDRWSVLESFTRGLWFTGKCQAVPGSDPIVRTIPTESSKVPPTHSPFGPQPVSVPSPTPMAPPMVVPVIPVAEPPVGHEPSRECIPEPTPTPFEADKPDLLPIPVPVEVPAILPPLLTGESAGVVTGDKCETQGLSPSSMFCKPILPRPTARWQCCPLISRPLFRCR